MAPPMKKRKTINGPLTNEEMAQTNSTAQLFAGAASRQNRWMAGYLQQEANGQLGQQTGVISPPDNTVRPIGEGNATISSNANANAGPRRSLPSQVGIGIASAVQQEQATAAVQYDAPDSAVATNDAIHIIDNAAPRKRVRPRKSLEQRNIPQPGLPSPASSDGNLRSPAPTNDTLAGIGPPTMQQMNQQYARPQPACVPVQAAASSHFQQGPYHLLPPQQPVPQRSATFTLPSLQPAAMMSTVTRFLRQGQAKGLLNAIDSGRLLLLQEAIDKGDWFYLCLSQIYALSANHSNLPGAAKTQLTAQSFIKLSHLLSTNTEVTPRVLQWLADFPTPIIDIYTSNDQQLYNPLLGAVVRFLIHLPAQWEGFMSECNKVSSPPLVEEMHKRFWLESPILQTTVFRAVARMIWDKTNVNGAGEGVEALETLHKLNQDAFLAGIRRDDAMIRAGQDAFREALQAWLQYQRSIAVHESRQSTVPPAARSAHPKFTLPRNVVAAFQPWIPPQTRPQQRFFQNQPPTMPRVSSAPINGQPITRPVNAAQNRHSAPIQVLQSNAPRPTFGSILNIETQVVDLTAPPGHHFFPLERDQPRPQPTHPDPIRSALHQAHLRSPILTPMDGLDGSRLYRTVTGFAMRPTNLNGFPMEYMTFTVFQRDFDKIPATQCPDSTDCRSTRVIDTTSRLYRLRCAAVPAGGFPSEKRWLETDNVWPDGVYLALNGQPLETRNKLHHGKYLPVDLTALIQPGDNRITIGLLRSSKDPRPFNYALAVEVIGITSHDDIVAGLTQLSAKDSLDSIKKSLSSGSDSDEDIAVTSSNTTITITDPYYGDRIVTLPVRGSGCLHKDCFDLEIFLSAARREQPDWPTHVDVWRCPICRGDARPQTLLVDGFIVDVRKELLKKSLTATRAIVVEEDGSWKAKEEEKTGVRSDSLEREEAVTTTTTTKKVIEIVELD